MVLETFEDDLMQAWQYFSPALYNMKIRYS